MDSNGTRYQDVKHKILFECMEIAIHKSSNTLFLGYFPCGIYQLMFRRMRESEKEMFAKEGKLWSGIGEIY